MGPLNEYKNLHFDNEQNLPMSSKTYIANGYMHDLDLFKVSGCSMGIFLSILILVRYI